MPRSLQNNVALNDLMELWGLVALLSILNDCANCQSWEVKKYHQMLILMNFKDSHMGSDLKSKPQTSLQRGLAQWLVFEDAPNLIGFEYRERCFFKKERKEMYIHALKHAGFVAHHSPKGLCASICFHWKSHSLETMNSANEIFNIVTIYWMKATEQILIKVSFSHQWLMWKTHFSFSHYFLTSNPRCNTLRKPMLKLYILIWECFFLKSKSKKTIDLLWSYCCAFIIYYC